MSHDPGRSRQRSTTKTARKRRSVRGLAASAGMGMEIVLTSPVGVGGSGARDGRGDSAMSIDSWVESPRIAGSVALQARAQERGVLGQRTLDEGARLPLNAHEARDIRRAESAEMHLVPAAGASEDGALESVRSGSAGAGSAGLVSPAGGHGERDDRAAPRIGEVEVGGVVGE